MRHLLQALDQRVDNARQQGKKPSSDFFYVCPIHLKDSRFCTPIVDTEAEAAKKRKEALDREIERVKKEYEEKMRRKKAKEEEKKQSEKGDDKDGKNDGDKTKSEDDEKKAEKEKNDKGIVAKTTKNVTITRVSDALLKRLREGYTKDKKLGPIYKDLKEISALPKQAKPKLPYTLDKIGLLWHHMGEKRLCIPYNTHQELFEQAHIKAHFCLERYMYRLRRFAIHSEAVDDVSDDADELDFSVEQLEEQEIIQDHEDLASQSVVSSNDILDTQNYDFDTARDGSLEPQYAMDDHDQHQNQDQHEQQQQQYANSAFYEEEEDSDDHSGGTTSEDDLTDFLQQDDLDPDLRKMIENDNDENLYRYRNPEFVVNHDIYDYPGNIYHTESDSYYESDSSDDLD
ncbi:hypothetical protein KEM55_003878, partial [Ascosphaera atra]